MSKKFSNEEVEKILESKGLKMLANESYKGVDEPLPCIDSKGYYVYCTLYRIKSGNQPSRFGNGNPYTIRNIKHFISHYAENASGITLISDKFVRYDKKLEFNCEVHGEFELSWNKFSNGRRCPKCGRENIAIKQTKTHEEFINEVYDLVGDEYAVLSEYKTAKDKIIIRHNKCGYRWHVIPDTFIRGARCPKCMRKISDLNRRKTQEEFEKEFYHAANGEYELLSEYVATDKKIWIKHKTCGKIYQTYPGSFLAGKRCRECAIREFADTRIKTQEEFEKEVYELVGNEYVVLGEYIKANIHIKLKHAKCGHIWDITPANFLSGKRCPLCNESKGENMIRKYLKKNHIKFKREYAIKECKNIHPLPFDFAIFNKDKLVALIEYQGQQHYEAIDFFNGEEGFKYRQKNDSIKRNYCKLNNIPLVEIPYTIENIKEYLDKQLSELNKSIQFALLK